MPENSLSDQVVKVETVIWQNERATLRMQRMVSRVDGRYTEPFMMAIRVPPSHEIGRVSTAAHRESRSKKQQACADIVITTMLPVGGPAVVAIKRSVDESFEGKWWMQGGSVPSYRSYSDFVVERARKECGVTPIVEGKIGVYRTCAEDVIGDTAQTCYVGFIPFADLARAQADRDHPALRVFTAHELDVLPEEERHWYPMRVFRLALATMPE